MKYTFFLLVYMHKEDSIKVRETYGLDTEGYCSIPMVGEWKLHFMAKNILEILWNERQDAVEEAIELIKTNYMDESRISDKNHILSLENQIHKSERRIKALTEMRMDGEITKSEYAQMCKKEEETIAECQAQLSSANNEKSVVSSLDEQLHIIRSTLMELIDFSGNTIDDYILERLIVQVNPMADGKFSWVLNLLGDREESDVVCGVLGRKNAPSFQGEELFSLPSFQPSTGCIKRAAVISLRF